MRTRTYTSIDLAACARLTRERGVLHLSDVSKKMALACHIEGRGPALIMFHGGTGSWTHWIRNIPALREHFTLHAYDLPGNGDSPSVPTDIAPHDATISEETIDIQRANVARQRFNTQPFTGGSLTGAALPMIKVPTLGIFGARDNLSWPDVSARIDPCRELMPAMRIELIPDAGHWVQYERPEPVNRLLIEFLRQA